jgi:heme a synthase
MGPPAARAADRLAFVVPFLAFWLAGRIDRVLAPRLAALFVLGAAQGVLGWYMVMSGLVERVSVSQYRLAAHLTLAVVIFAAILWVALGIGRARGKVTSTRAGWAALALLGLVMVQIAAGGFVAGLRAGMGYNTWPLIDGAIIPAGLAVMEPWWRNLFENALTVQFVHRMLAYAIALAALANAAVLWRRGPAALASSAMVLAASVLAQSAIGIATLLAQVPMGLALAHQAGGLLGGGRRGVAPALRVTKRRFRLPPPERGRSARRAGWGLTGEPRRGGRSIPSLTLPFSRGGNNGGDLTCPSPRRGRR